MNKSILLGLQASLNGLPAIIEEEDLFLNAREMCPATIPYVMLPTEDQPCYYEKKKP